MNDLQGNIAIETRIPRLEYDTHASGADLSLDAVRPDKTSGRKESFFSAAASALGLIG